MFLASKLSWMSVILCVFVSRWMSSHAFDLTILHTNDIHSRFEETDKNSGVCSPSAAQNKECFGGSARLRSMVKEERAKYPNQTLLLDAGDEFQGTLWYYKFRGLVVSRFMNLIGYDAMAIGNHEFDDGPDGLLPFANNISFPLLSSNINFNLVPSLGNVVKKSVELQVGGERIGIVGYTTELTPYLSSPGPDVIFNPELEAIQEEIDKLTQRGVNKIIALGHSGFDVDVQLAAKLKGVDVIVGGHTNTFLYNGTAPSNEVPSDFYPKVVTNTNGEQVLVVQDYAYGKYLGELHVTFDNNGKVTSYYGNPILLNDSVVKDAEIEAVIKTYLPELDALKQEVVGHSLVHLSQENLICRIRECNLGNLIADGMIYYTILRKANSSHWTDVAIAVVNGGSIRAPLEPGNITLESILTVAPFRNTIDIIELEGKTIMEMLEFGATLWNPNIAYGGFLQVSGMKIIYDMRRPSGKRVLQVLVMCTDCVVPRFEPLVPSRVYKILMSSFVSGGGDGYTMIADKLIKKYPLGFLDSDSLTKYIKQRSPVYPSTEGRIQFLDELEASGMCDFMVCSNDQSQIKACKGSSLFNWSVNVGIIALMATCSLILTSTFQIHV